MTSLQRCTLCHKRSSSSLGCCTRCAAELFQPQYYGKGLYLGSYNGQLRRAVQAFKFKGTTRLAELFAKALATELAKDAGTTKLDLLCPVPLHWLRYLHRGYNQSALIAKALAERTAVPYAKVLRRTKATAQQAKLNKLERQSNVSDAFRAKSVSGKRVGLIDDVVTTGATMLACEQVLLEAGALTVMWLSITAYPGVYLKNS